MLHRALAPSLAFGLAAGLLTPGVARADDGHALSPGLLMSLSLGDKTAFGLGLDLRYTALLVDTACGSRRGAGVGVFGQAHWLNFSAGRFAAGLHGGSEIEQGQFGAGGELGWSYRSALGQDHLGGHGFHAGAMSYAHASKGDLFPIFELSFRGTFPFPGEAHQPEVTIGTGLRLLPVYSPPSTCVVGRPVRIEGAQALGPVLAAATRARALPMDEVTRAALAHAWLEDARGECASIPAFLALARDLRAVGAPDALVLQALAGARDEVRHAALCAARAGEYAAMDILPIAPPLPAAGDPSRAAALARLGWESWQDGCLGEGAAAARARRALGGAEDPDVRAALARIAVDEQRHADLAWDVLAYCLAEGGRATREALAEAILAPEPAPPEAEEARGDFDPKPWRGHGQLEVSGVESTWAETWSNARRAGEKLLQAA